MTGPSIEEVILGMQYASMSITDDKPDTLKNVGKLNPWHIEALAMITGSEEEPFLPLSTLLHQHFGLTVDTMIDESRINKGGHFIDTQGYIAHSDDKIVVAFRCTTSAYDWLTNFDTTSSEWELEEDAELGFSGYCSSMEGLTCCQCIFGKSQHKPRVHTGCYNNILATLPVLEKYVNPLLGPDQPPRTLYVVGHSLGAGIANLAGMYFLFEHDWSALPQRLLTITAGSPRVCQVAMKEVVEKELAKYGPDNASILRIVRNKDIVPTVPPSWLGFRHIGKLVYISQDDELQMDGKANNSRALGNNHDDDDDDDDGAEPTKPDENLAKTRSLVQAASRAVLEDDSDDDDDDDDDNGEKKPKDKSREAKYFRMIRKIPLALRDHMPDSYMRPMKSVREALFPAHHLVGDGVKMEMVQEQDE